MFAILNLNKPRGITSRTAVNQIQRIVRPVKVGHAGTLDPLAWGVLVICLGPATRLIQYIQQAPKIYRGEFLLGRQSDTEDIEGEVLELPEPPEPTQQQIEAVLPEFIGQISQRPPAYSAIKVNGRRAYKLARSGQEVSLPPRQIRVDRIELLDYSYPKMTLEIECGGGVYVRSLGRDIALRLQTAAVMSSLVRTAIGCFKIEQASRLEEISSETIESHLLSPLLAVESLPKVQLTEEEQQRINLGQTIENRIDLSTEAAAIDGSGRLTSILKPKEPGLLKAARNFPL